MRELSVKAYTASIASFYQSIIHKSFSSQTLGKQGWVERQGEGSTAGVVGERERMRDRGKIGQSPKYEERQWGECEDAQE